MRTLIAFSVVAGVASAAWARPDHDHVPPGAFRSETQMRMPVDGRGETMERGQPARQDPWERAARPQSTIDRAPPSAQPQLPLKSEIQQKAQQGDHREMAAKPQALDPQAQAAKPSTDRMGRPEAKPVLPLKTDIALRAQNGGDSREPSSSSAAPNAKSPDDKDGKRARNPMLAKPPRLDMTAHDRQMLCRQVGLCLPQSAGSDDVEDKTE